MEEFNLIDTTDKLLYAILLELRKMNSKNETPIVESKLCPLCGKDHSNTGYALACAKKQKKGSA